MYNLSLSENPNEQNFAMEAENPTYDVYISYGEREATIATRLRADLPIADVTCHPDQPFSKPMIMNSRIVIALQTSRKPDQPVRAAMAVAQQVAYDRPIITVYIQDDSLALRRIGKEPIYVAYAVGVLKLVKSIWTITENNCVHYFDKPDDQRDSHPLQWLATIMKQPDGIHINDDPAN